MPNHLSEKYRPSIESTEANIVKFAKHLMIELKLLPHDFLKFLFDDHVLEYERPNLTPKYYLLSLERHCILVDAFSDFLDNAIKTAESYVEAKYYREMQIAVLKKLEAFFKIFHEKVKDFYGKTKISLEEGVDLKSISGDFSYFVAQYYPNLYGKWADCTADFLELCFDKDEPLIPCFVGESLEKYYAFEKEIETLIDKQREVIKHIESAKRQEYESKLKKTIGDWEGVKKDLRQNLGITAKGRKQPLKQTKTVRLLCEQYDTFKKEFEDLKYQVENYLMNGRCRDKPYPLDKGSELIKAIGKLEKTIEICRAAAVNFHTLFHVELDYAEKVIQKLQTELISKCPGLTTPVVKDKTKDKKSKSRNATKDKTAATTGNEDETLGKSKAEKRKSSGNKKSDKHVQPVQPQTSTDTQPSSKKHKTGPAPELVDLTGVEESFTAQPLNSSSMPCIPSEIIDLGDNVEPTFPVALNHPGCITASSTDPYNSLREQIQHHQPTPLLYQWPVQQSAPLLPSSTLPSLPGTSLPGPAPSQTLNNGMLSSPLPAPVDPPQTSQPLLLLSNPSHVRPDFWSTFTSLLSETQRTSFTFD